MKKLFKNYSLHPAVLFDDIEAKKDTFCYLVDKKRGCQQGKQRRCQKTWQWVENCAKYIKPDYDPASAQKVLRNIDRKILTALS